MSPKVLIACLALHCDLFINDAKYAVIAEVGELFRGWGWNSPFNLLSTKCVTLPYMVGISQC